jgi:hypothetical protein
MYSVRISAKDKKKFTAIIEKPNETYLINHTNTVLGTQI